MYLCLLWNLDYGLVELCAYWRHVGSVKILIKVAFDAWNDHISMEALISL